jgi:hypothetical protein
MAEVSNTTLRVAELRKLATFPLDALSLEIGPMALVQKPADQLLEQAALKHALARTVPSRPKIATHALSLMLGFDDMLVVPIGNKSSTGELVMGRALDAEVHVADASASGYHARLRWDAWKRTVWLADLGSTNGTFINGKKVGKDEVPVLEGETLSLGDAAFMLVSAETLHALLRST